MNLPDFLDPRKQEGRGVYIGLIMALTPLGAFGLGRLSVEMGSQRGLQVVGERVSANALGALQYATSTGKGGTEATPGGVVASKTGGKYFYPWCGGASAIKKENTIWFVSIVEARAAGYQPASNCKGLQ